MVHTFDTLDSTNAYMRTNGPWQHGDAVVCRRQTAGRGQRGNSWESEEGKNITASFYAVPPHLAAADQFLLSCAAALAVVDTVSDCVGQSDRVCVKWPNDVYIGDRKVAGLLIENSITGRDIHHSVIGIGLNVNQMQFRSDAPNPVSVAQVTGREHDLDGLLEALAGRLAYRTLHLEGVLEEYSRHLWRREGYHPYVLGDGRTPLTVGRPDDTLFMARTEGVASDGRITLRLTDGRCRSFTFKEIHAVL